MIGPPTSASPRPPVEVKTTSSDVSTSPVARDAAAVDRRPGANPVRLGHPFVPTPAAAAEDDHPGGQLDVAVAAARDDHRRHEEDERRVSLRGGKGLDQIGIQRPLPPRALNVHDRAFTRHRDGFRERADSQVDVQRGNEVSRQLESFASHGAEPVQRERHRVGAGAQFGNPVLPGPVGHRRSRPSRSAPGSPLPRSRRARPRLMCP